MLDGNGEIAGTMFEYVDITNAYVMLLSRQLAEFTGGPQHSYTLTGTNTAIGTGQESLTTRESEILFLILRGKTAKLAAMTLGLSLYTIEQHLESIKLKFGANSKVELIDAAIERGYLSYIPTSIFTRQLSIVLASD
jgi:DNA-binding CsgD family transcriptional regulator